MASIPTIDISPFMTSTDPSTRKKAALKLAEACHTHGAVGIVGHGVSSEMIAEAFKLTKTFFDLPLEDKMKAPHPPTLMPHRGYSYPGMEKAFSKSELETGDEAVREKGRKTIDFKENYDVGSKDNHQQENIWPPESLLPGFSSCVSKLYDELHKTCVILLDALLIGLNLTEKESEHIRKLHPGLGNHLRLLHYPPLSAEDLDDASMARLPAHTDWTSTFTLLFQDSNGGLEFANPADGKFMPATPDGDKLYLNIGDMFDRLSNNYYPSALHRVIVPKNEVSTEGGKSQPIKSRYSIPYFFMPEPTVVISPQKSCITEENPKKYGDITLMEYIAEMGKWQYGKSEEK